MNAPTARKVVLEAIVVDGKAQPIEGALVQLCARASAGRGELSRCEEQLAERVSSHTGAVRLTTAPTVLDTSVLIVSRTGYETAILTGSELERAVRKRRTQVVLTMPATVRVTARRSDGASFSRPRFGWYARRGDVLRVRHSSCCADESGAFTFPEGVPSGEVSVFAVDSGEPARYAEQAVTLAPGAEQHLQLTEAHALHTVRVRTLDAEGAAVSGLVSVEPIEPSQLSDSDRALIALHGGTSSLDGSFEVSLLHARQVRIEFATWVAGDGKPSTHIGRRVLARRDVDVASDALVALHAGPERVVDCSMFDGDGSRLAIDELGLFFGPHVGWGHSGSCVDLSTSAQTTDAAPVGSPSVRFVWPDGTDVITVTAQARMDARSYEGALELRAGGPCRITGHAAP